MAPDDPRTWDRRAVHYARQERWESRAVGHALDLLDPGPEERLLDAATGTGLVLRTLAARARRSDRAVGIDRSAGMLVAVGPLPATWATREGDLTALPLADRSVDVAVASYVLHLQTDADRAATLRELHRVLVPGGRLVTVTPWTPRRPGRAVMRVAAGFGPLAGLAPFDPRDALCVAGFSTCAAAFLRGGYPSLVVLARG